MTDAATDLHEERERCWRRLVDLVCRYRAGNVSGVVQELRAVEQAKGRVTAEALRDQIKACAAAESWQTVEEWPNNGYVPTQRKDGRYGKRK